MNLNLENAPYHIASVNHHSFWLVFEHKFQYLREVN